MTAVNYAVAIDLYVVHYSIVMRRTWYHIVIPMMTLLLHYSIVCVLMLWSLLFTFVDTTVTHCVEYYLLFLMKMHTYTLPFYWWYHSPEHYYIHTYDGGNYNSDTLIFTVYCTLMMPFSITLLGEPYIQPICSLPLHDAFTTTLTLCFCSVIPSITVRCLGDLPLPGELLFCADSITDSTVHTVTMTIGGGCFAISLFTWEFILFWEYIVYCS